MITLCLNCKESKYNEHLIDLLEKKMEQWKLNLRHTIQGNDWNCSSKKILEIFFSIELRKQLTRNSKEFFFLELYYLSTLDFFFDVKRRLRVKLWGMVEYGSIFGFRKSFLQKELEKSNLRKMSFRSEMKRRRSKLYMRNEFI